MPDCPKTQAGIGRHRFHVHEYKDLYIETSDIHSEIKEYTSADLNNSWPQRYKPNFSQTIKSSLLGLEQHIHDDKPLKHLSQFYALHKDSVDFTSL